MAREKKESEWNTWETLPDEGQQIIFTDATGENEGIYKADEWEVVISDDFKWKPNETKPNETEEELFRDSEFKMLETEYVEMITEWMQKKRGMIASDLDTNIPPRNFGKKKVQVLVLSFNSGVLQ
jgi:hypothetical protein